MQTAYFIFAFIAVLALIGVAAWLVRRFATNRLGANTNRGRMPRLAVIDAAAVDGRRRLVLVRRDNVEHLLMIGGPSDIVVEPNIVRAMPGRDQMAPRPAVAGEQPPRIAPLPDAGWNDDGARDPFDHAEPQMPEPPPRPARPAFADEVRRPAPPPMAGAPPTQRSAWQASRRSRWRGRPEPRPDPVPPRLTRTDDRADDAAAAAPDGAAEGAAAGPRARARRSTAAATPAACASAAVQRRPESRRDGAAARSRPAPAGRGPDRAAGRARAAARPPRAQRDARRPRARAAEERV